MGGASRQAEILGVRACLLQYLCKMRICWKWSKVINNVGRTEKMKLIEEWIIEQFSREYHKWAGDVPCINSPAHRDKMYFWPIIACISHLGKSSFPNIERNLPEKRNHVRGHPPLINDVILQFWRHNGPMSIWTSSGFSSSVILLEHSCHYFSAIMKVRGEIGAQDQKLSWNECYFFLEATIHFPDFKQFFTLCLLVQYI